VLAAWWLALLRRMFGVVVDGMGLGAGRVGRMMLVEVLLFGIDNLRRNLPSNVPGLRKGKPVEMALRLQKRTVGGLSWGRLAGRFVVNVVRYGIDAVAVAPIPQRQWLSQRRNTSRSRCPTVRAIQEAAGAGHTWALRFAEPAEMLEYSAQEPFAE
jgi:hypothetical protein